MKTRNSKIDIEINENENKEKEKIINKIEKIKQPKIQIEILNNNQYFVSYSEEDLERYKKQKILIENNDLIIINKDLFKLKPLIKKYYYEVLYHFKWDKIFAFLSFWFVFLNIIFICFFIWLWIKNNSMIEKNNHSIEKLETKINKIESTNNDYNVFYKFIYDKFSWNVKQNLINNKK